MTKRDLFRILIKVIALYYLINMPAYLLKNLTFLFEGFYGSSLEMFSYSAYTILSSAIIVGVLLFLVFCGDSLINLFKLDKSFDDDHINLTKITSSQVLEIGVVLIGGFTAIMAFPNFLYYGFDILREFFYSRGVYDAPANWQGQYFAIALIQMILGVILLSNYRRISRYFFKQNERNEAVEE